MKMLRLKHLLPWLCAVTFLIGANSARAEWRPLVLVSVPEQAYFVQRLAGEIVEVQNIIPPGVTSETYEPSLRQLQQYSRASLYIQLGHPQMSLESAWVKSFKKIAPEMEIANATQGATLDAHDPHVWLSTAVARVMATNSAAALERLMPQHSESFRTQLKEVLREIDTVQGSLEKTFEGCSGKAFLVFHPAWGYFAKEFGLVQLAIEAEGKMPTPGGLARVVADAKRHRVRAVFVSPGHSEESAEVVARELGVKIVSIDPLGADWAKTMLDAGAAIRAGLGE